MNIQSGWREVVAVLVEQVALDVWRFRAVRKSVPEFWLKGLRNEIRADRGFGLYCAAAYEGYPGYGRRPGGRLRSE